MKKIDIIRKFPTPTNCGVCTVCRYFDTCDRILPGFHKPGKCGGPFINTYDANELADSEADESDDDRLRRYRYFSDELVKRTFVPKSHNALKLTERMAREMFNDGVRIIVRPAGRNSLERGAVYRRGETLVWKWPQTADTFEQVIDDFKSGFGSSDADDTFRYYLYMD